MASLSVIALFNNIANAIRSKTQSSAAIIADDFATAISNIPIGTTAISGTYTVSNNQIIVTVTSDHSVFPSSSGSVTGGLTLS